MTTSRLGFFLLSIYTLLVVSSATNSDTDNAFDSSSSNEQESSRLRYLSTNLTSIHFIGDLHGDVNCAKEWVQKTNLVNLTTTPYTWIGQETDAIVFLGDYVDKGSTSASVLTFIKELQTTFVHNVVSILGNHDFFQVLDAALEYNEEYPHPLGHPQHDYVYSFVHPEEYVESGYSPSRDDDDVIMKAIYEALEYVYDRRAEGKVKFCSSEYCIKSNQNDRLDLFTAVPPFDEDVELASRARERLMTWRDEYMKGLYESGLLHWMIEQPIVAIVGDALLVHGGMTNGIAHYAAKKAKESEISVEDSLFELVNNRFTTFFQKHLGSHNNTNNADESTGAGTDTGNGGANSIKERLTEGYAFEIIMTIIQHRGYFKENGRTEVEEVIGLLQNEKVNRISVGHTPRDYAEEFCGGKLLATDSSLSRSFRAYGNLYCPLDERFQKNISPEGGYIGSCSQTTFVDKCDGSISVLVRESPEHEWPTNVKHIHMDSRNDPNVDISLSESNDVKEEL